MYRIKNEHQYLSFKVTKSLSLMYKNISVSLQTNLSLNVMPLIYQVHCGLVNFSVTWMVVMFAHKQSIG